MDKVDAFSLLARFAQAKAEGRKVKVLDPRLLAKPDPADLVSAARLMSGDFVVEIDERAPPLVPWSAEEAKKHIGKAWRRADAVSPIFIIGQYTEGKAWAGTDAWGRDWSVLEYAEPEWGTDSSTWDWKPCAKAPTADPVFQQLAIFARGMAANARVRILQSKMSGMPYARAEVEQFELGVCGAEGLNECASSFADYGYRVVAVLYPQYTVWTDKEARVHVGFAHRRIRPDQCRATVDGIIGHMWESLRPWDASSAYWENWSDCEYAKPVWGTCPSTWDWKPCRTVTGYLPATEGNPTNTTEETKDGTD